MTGNECWTGPYCEDCPDREGCGQGVPCDTARSVAGLPLVHSPAAHDVIAAELVACTLGQRHRPELRTDLAGVMARALQGFRRALGLDLPDRERAAWIRAKRGAR